MEKKERENESEENLCRRVKALNINAKIAGDFLTLTGLIGKIIESGKICVLKYAFANGRIDKTEVEFEQQMNFLMQKMTELDLVIKRLQALLQKINSYEAEMLVCTDIIRDSRNFETAESKNLKSRLEDSLSKSEEIVNAAVGMIYKILERLLNDVSQIKKLSGCDFGSEESFPKMN